MVKVETFPNNLQVIAFVAHIEKATACMSEWLVQYQHEPAIEGVEEHTVPAVMPYKGLQLLPGSLKLP